jgi:hypothetical protein
MRRLRRAHQKWIRRREKLKRRAITASTTAVFTLGTCMTANSANLKPAQLNHQLPVRQDADADLLSNLEEVAIGYNPFRANQNSNSILDGVELAQRCADVIDKLPLEQDVKDPNQPYKWFMYQRGIETCDICGEKVNMGTIGIANPSIGLEVECPVIAIHYLEHGSFSYQGDIHSGRTKVPALLRVLGIRYPYVPDAHELPLDYEVLVPLALDANDLDGDLLADSEELDAGLNLYNSDQNANLVPDGVELAKSCARVIASLPVYQYNQEGPAELHKVNFMQKGLEVCEICGEAVNMGYWQLVNPVLGMRLDVSEIECHYMSHGSFSYHGNNFGDHQPLHYGRVDVGFLLKILQMPRSCGDLGAIYFPSDLNQDCKVDFTDFSEFAEQWLRITVPE